MKYNMDKIFFTVKSVLISFQRPQRPRKTLGQNLTEFALCMAVVTSAFVSMQMYIQRNLQAKQKGALEYLHSEIEKEAVSKGNNKLAADLKNLNRQYEVYYKNSEMTEITENETNVKSSETKTRGQVTRSGEEKTGF